MSDWDTVTVLRKKAPTAAASRSSQVRGMALSWLYAELIKALCSLQAVNNARRKGETVTTSVKCTLVSCLVPHFISSWHMLDVDGAGGNKQRSTDKNTARLDEETDELKRKQGDNDALSLHNDSSQHHMCVCR
jgi:putative transcription factor